MNLFGERLKDERQRLDFSQEKFGAVGGVQKLAQRNYEKGNRVPDASYMAAIAAVGADVLYILTGQRNASMPALQPDEAALLSSYRHCTPAAKQNLIQTAALLAAGIEPEAKKQKKKSTGIKVSGDNNRVAGKNYQE